MKKLSLGIKLSGGFLIVGCIVLLVGIGGWNGIHTLDGIIADIEADNKLEKQLLQGEIDHLNWARKVGQFQRDVKLTDLGVEKDEHQCGFGKWYYSEERINATNEMDSLTSLMNRLEEPHKRIHQSAGDWKVCSKKAPSSVSRLSPITEANSVAVSRKYRNFLP